MCSKQHCVNLPMNTQSVSSSIKYRCFSNLRQRQETKMITVLIRLDFLLTCYNLFKKNNTNEEETGPSFVWFCCLVFFLMSLICPKALFLKKGQKDRYTRHQSILHKAQSPLWLLPRNHSKRSFSKCRQSQGERKWTLPEAAGAFGGQQCFVFNEALMQVSNCVPPESKASEGFSTLL